MADEQPADKKETTDEPVQENPPKPNPLAGQESLEEALKEVEDEDRFEATDN